MLTHNRGGIGGQNDNVCRVVGAGAEELTNRRWRVDFVLWNHRNPNRRNPNALTELDEHCGSSCDDARTAALMQWAPGSEPMMMLRVNPDGWRLIGEKRAGTRVRGQAVRVLMVARLAPAVAAAKASSRPARRERWPTSSRSPILRHCASARVQVRGTALHAQRPGRPGSEDEAPLGGGGAPLGVPRGGGGVDGGVDARRRRLRKHPLAQLAIPCCNSLGANWLKAELLSS